MYLETKNIELSRAFLQHILDQKNLNDLIARKNMKRLKNPM